MTTWRPLFITGTARSGSNLLGRILCAHSDIMLAMDPYLPLYRSLRNAILRHGLPEHYQSAFDPNMPFQDYYFSEHQLGMMDTVLKGSLDLPVEPAEWNTLMPQVVSRCNDENPDLIDALTVLQQGRSYGELFQHALNLIAEKRHVSTGRWVGCKDVWTIDYYPALARAFPEAKFIVILRDPRASLASNEGNPGSTTRHGHAISFLRHWRKLVTLAWYYRQDPELSSRLFLVRYEDLLSDADGVIKDACRFLDTDFEEGMLVPDNWYDYSHNRAWKGNSSFDTTTSAIDKKRVDKWKTVLSEELVALTNWLCGPEMDLLGYSSRSEYKHWASEQLGEILEHAFIACNSLTYTWRSMSTDIHAEFSSELMRQTLLGMRQPCSSDQLVRRSFLFADYYRYLTNTYLQDPPTRLV